MSTSPWPTPYKAPRVPWPHLGGGAPHEFLELLAGLPDDGTPCAADPQLWSSDHPTGEEHARARAGCSRCPVLAQCAAYAEQLRPTTGTWAGVVWTGSGPRGHHDGRYAP